MRALACLLPIVLTAAAPEPAVLDTLAPDAEARWIPFDLTPANQIRFEASVDGRAVGAILDTGVSYSVLARSFVDAAKMRVRPSGAAIAIGGAVASGWVDTRSIALGGLTRRGGRVTTATLPQSATGGVPVQMLVGRDLTGGYALDIDYDARRFRLLPSGRLPFPGAVAPLHISGSWPSYVTAITVGSRSIARITVDTGDGSALTLTHPAWATLPEARAASSTTVAYGIGGPVVLDVAIVPTMHVGATVANAIEARVEPEGGYTSAIGMNGRIGSGFLARYHVLLDPAAGRMVLSPGRLAEAAPLRSTSGLVLHAGPTRLTVLHVMRGGPAAASGWRAGDQICSVDGLPVTTRSALDWPVAAPGRTVNLGLCDGSARSLTLRAFY